MNHDLERGDSIPLQLVGPHEAEGRRLERLSVFLTAPTEEIYTERPPIVPYIQPRELGLSDPSTKCMILRSHRT